MDLLLDGEEDAVRLKAQLPYLTDSEYEYTGVGLFVSFEQNKGIEPTILENERTILNGVEITSTELEIGADATLFVFNGLIDYLEIWSYSGNYPANELSNYCLKQIWKNSPGRSISKPKNNTVSQ